jgi:kumamolisin
LGDVAPTQTASLTIALRPRSPDALSAAFAQQHAAPLAAPLTPDDVATLVGPPQATVDAVAAFFQANGFTFQSVERDHLSLKVTGTLGQVQQTLGVQLGLYRDRAGHTFRAPATDPQVPASLASSIQAIFGLDTYPALQRLYQQQSSPTPGQYTPADIRTAYNVTPLLNMGLNGAGQTIAIVGCDTFQLTDIQGFNTFFSLPGSTIHQVNVDVGPQGDQPETTLDLEWSHAMAPGATLDFYGFGDPTNGSCSLLSFLDALNQVKTDNAASIVSISLGACEQSYISMPYGSSTLLVALENALGAGALEGESVFVASGDQGAYCTDGSGNIVLGMSYPASSAYVTAVGGTRLNLNGDSTYQSETAWNGTCTGGNGQPVPCGTGGGKSAAISEPSWQSNSSVPILPTGGWRGVPDVALDADPTTGYDIWWYSPTNNCFGLCPDFGGTSIGTPEWAGYAAMADQNANRRLGNLSPLLYGPSILSGRPNFYHDVVTGCDEPVPNCNYTALPGWDFATGWGSPNACHVVLELGIAAGAAVATSPLGGAATNSLFQVFLPIVYQNGWNC